MRGKLRFRGGLELHSSDRDFGGLSGLLVSSDGTRFVAVSDEAHWVTGNLDYEGGNEGGKEGGNLAGVRGDTIAPLLDLDGKPLAGKAGDAEGLASGDGESFDDLFVSFEQKNRVWRYSFGAAGTEAVPTDLALPDKAHDAPPNGGLEGITRIDEDVLLAVSEHFRNDVGNYRAWIIPFPLAGPAPPGITRGLFAPGVPPHQVEMSIAPRHPFAMTDVRQLSNGDVLTLERRFDPVHGVGVELRRIPWASLKQAAIQGSAPPLDGEVLATFDQNDEIDNMEGLSIRRGSRGETLVYLISDDNFNGPLQRTLLWMFELVD